MSEDTIYDPHIGGITADSFEELADIAIRELSNHTGVSMVCGPVSTGGTGSKIHNFEIFNAAIRGLERRGVHVFNQIPYELGLQTLSERWRNEGNTGYCTPILTIFYARVFECGAISDGWFIPGWASSFGAGWERGKLVREECVIHDLSHDDIFDFLKSEYPIDHAEKLIKLVPR